MAVRNGRPEQCRRLMIAGADLKGFRMSVVRSRLKSTGCVGAHCRECVHQINALLIDAARGGCGPDVLEMLLNLGADVRSIDKVQCSAFAVLRSRARFEQVGMTAVHHAVGALVRCPH